MKKNTQISRAKEFLKELSVNSGVSGYEASLASRVIKEFESVADDVHTDRFGNIYALKKASSDAIKRIIHSTLSIPSLKCLEHCGEECRDPQYFSSQQTCS